MSNDRLKFVIEAVVIVAAVLLIAIASKPSTVSENQSAMGGHQQVVFPAEIPMAVGATGYRETSNQLPNGQVQVKNSFLSTSTTSATFSFYKQFFGAASASANGGVGSWMFLAQINNPQDPAHKSILARNANGMLTVNITAQSASTALVEMTFVSNP